MSAKPPGTEWLALRACADMPVAVFFPEDSHGVTRAKAICATCPVRVDCLQSAMDNDERFGIWGGTSERQRRFMRYQRRNGVALGSTVEHGVYRYNTGCRCNVCRLAKAASKRYYATSVA